MPPERVVNKNTLYVYALGVALMVLLLFFIKPYVLSIVNVGSPVCAAIVPRYDTQSVATLRSVSLKYGWLYVVVYNDASDIERLVGKIDDTISPNCIAIGVFPDDKDKIHLSKIENKNPHMAVFLIPEERQKMLKYLYRRGKDSEDISH